jgi:hypothetical protein
MGRTPPNAPRCAALAALPALLCACGEAEPAAEAPTGNAGGAAELRPYAVQLHAHGSSEIGLASLDSIAREAAVAGLDAVWLTDHGRHLDGRDALSELSFEGDLPREWLTGVPADVHFEPAPWPALRPVPRCCEATGEVRLSEQRAFDGARSFQVSAASLGPEFQDYVAELEAPAPGYRRPLSAGVALEFALWIEGAGPDARVWVEAQLSEHPIADGSGGFGPTSVRYVVGADEGEPWREGPVLWIPLAGVEGRWRAYRPELSHDAARGFPELDALDDTLTAIRVGLSARNSAAITAFVDGVRVGAERLGGGVLDRRAEVLAGVARRHPGLALHQGLGLDCLGVHLNAFGPRVEAFDADAALRELAREQEAGRSLEAEARDFLARRAVEAAHAGGGLVSLNHPLGAAPAGSPRERRREAELALLLERGLYGADLLEVGYRDRGGHSLRDHLWLWDRLALEGGLRPVGIGTSDHHGGPERWPKVPNNFVSWIAARSTAVPDLLDGLRAGRVAFGDPTRFAGALALTTDRGQRMGQIVVTDRESVALEIAIDGLDATDRVILVESGELTRHLDAGGPAFRAREAIALPPQGGFVRVEVFARDGTALAYSNPIHFVRRLPEGGIDPARAAFDVAGVRSVDLGGFELSSVEPLADGGPGVALAGRGERCTLELSCPGLASPTVELKGLRAKIAIEGSRIRLEGLLGNGRIAVRGEQRP